MPERVQRVVYESVLFSKDGKPGAFPLPDTAPAQEVLRQTESYSHLLLIPELPMQFNFSRELRRVHFIQVGD